MSRLLCFSAALGLLQLVNVGSVEVLADENPVVPPPEVQTLTVNKDVPGGNVVLNWSDGTAPFAVQRSESANFLAPVNLTYVTRSTLGGPVNDPVLNDGLSYYYLVSDANALTQVYSIVSTAGVGFFEGEALQIDGVGFDASCANNAVFFDDVSEANLLSCSSTQIQAEIPAHALSGSVTVLSPGGVSTRQTKLIAVGLRTNPARVAQSHINVDTDHNLFVGDQPPSPTTNSITKIDFTTGAASTCATIGTPIGMPRLGTKFYVGSELDSPNNVGTVRELDASCTPLVNWGATGTATTDPVWARAMAVDPSGNNPGYVFLLDHAGDRIRRRQNNANLDTMWLTGLGLGGTESSASDPAGFTFNDAGEFFFTASPNKIRHYNASKSLLQEFTATDGVSRPSQIAFDEAQTLWVANRDGNNVLRLRTNPMDKLVRVKLAGITGPRGVALDRDPVTSDPWLYVADQTNVYRFRVYDTVHLDIKVYNEALTSPSGVKTSQGDFEKRVRQDAAAASDAFKFCGIEVVVDRVLFITDPNADGIGPDGTVITTLTPTLEQDELDTLATSRSSNAFAINAYYINHYLLKNAAPPPDGFTTRVNGFTYTNDFHPTITNTGVMIAVHSPQAEGGPLVTGSITSTLAHEIGHFLLNNFNNGGPGNIEHKGSNCGADADFIMHATACPTRKRFDVSNCVDMKTNGDESDFVERF